MPTWFSNKKNSTQSPSNDLPNEIEPSIQFLNNEKDRELYTGIYTKVTKEKHTYDRPQKGDRTLKRCIELFKQEADPEVLTKLEAFLREQIKLEKSLEKPGEYQKYHQYYIKHFLPALLRETIQSKELEKPEKPEKPEKLKTIKEIAGIISNTVKQDSKKEWNILLSKLETEITQLQKLRACT